MISGKSIVQQVLQRSADVSLQIIAPVQGQGGVSFSCACLPNATVSRSKTIWWVSLGRVTAQKSGEKQCNWWCTACGGQYTWRDPNRVLVIHDGADNSEAKVFRAHAPPQDACENVAFALKRVGHASWWRELGGYDAGVQEQRRLKIINELRRFIEVDHNEAAKICDLDEEIGGDQGGQVQVQQGDLPTYDHPRRNG